MFYVVGAAPDVGCRPVVPFRQLECGRRVPAGLEQIRPRPARAPPAAPALQALALHIVQPPVQCWTGALIRWLSSRSYCRAIPARPPETCPWTWGLEPVHLFEFGRLHAGKAHFSPIYQRFFWHGGPGSGRGSKPSGFRMFLQTLWSSVLVQTRVLHAGCTADGRLCSGMRRPRRSRSAKLSDSSGDHAGTVQDVVYK